jgi:hypothetical protein
MTMEFEELQKIWDSQYNRPLYALDEKALHSRIVSKRKSAHHITSKSELLSLLANLGGGCFVLAIDLLNQSGNVFMYLIAAWMLCTGVYVWVSRLRRIKGELQFDRSIHGDLHHAISMATYQVNFSRLMRWNILPMGAFVVLGLWVGSKPVWMVVMILIFFGLVYYTSGWEHRMYISRRRELELLKNKLESEEK